MRSSRETKFKIFDATIWILVSSLFYDWALLYLILVYAAIYFYEPKNVRIGCAARRPVHRLHDCQMYHDTDRP